MSIIVVTVCSIWSCPNGHDLWHLPLGRGNVIASITCHMSHVMCNEVLNYPSLYIDLILNGFLCLPLLSSRTLPLQWDFLKLLP